MGMQGSVRCNERRKFRLTAYVTHGPQLFLPPYPEDGFGRDSKYISDPKFFFNKNGFVSYGMRSVPACENPESRLLRMYIASSEDDINTYCS
jgi:hypothetical protein